MLNNLIKLLLDTDRLCLDDIEYDKSIPIEINPELNELEIKLRKELAYIHAMELQRGNVYIFKSQFEPKLSNRLTKNIILKTFVPIRDRHDDLNGLPFLWVWGGNDIDAYGPYFFKFKDQLDGESFSYYARPYEGYYWRCHFIIKRYKDPDDINNLYIDMGHDEYFKAYPSKKKKDDSIKMKKHRSKKWRNGKKK